MSAARAENNGRAAVVLETLFKFAGLLATSAGVALTAIGLFYTLVIAPAVARIERLEEGRIEEVQRLSALETAVKDGNRILERIERKLNEKGR